MLERTIPKISRNEEELKEQNKSLATRYYKRTPKDGLLSFSWPAQKIHDHIRALTCPYPGAFIIFKNKKLLIWKSSLGPDNPFPPGQICEIKRGKGILVTSGAKSIWLERVSYGDTEHWADDWVLSHGLSLGDNLVDCQNFK